MLNQPESAMYLSESAASHKVMVASHLLGIPVELHRVNVREPNHIGQTLGLLTEKLRCFKKAWRPTDEYSSGKHVVGTADVNVSYQAQGDYVSIEARKIDRSDLTLLAKEVSYRAGIFRDDNVVARIEAGLIFQRQYNHRQFGVATISRAYVTYPKNPMKDPGLLREYYAWSGMNEMHKNFPWSVDTVSFLAFLEYAKKLDNHNLDDLVKVPSKCKNHNNIENVLEVHQKLGRYNEKWSCHIDDMEIVCALLMMGSNFTINASDALMGAMRYPRNGYRIIYEH